jgi:hypothetical protein
MKPRRLEALLDGAVGAAMITTWIAPTLLGAGLLRVAITTFMLEFLVIHSAAFMGAAFNAASSARSRLRALLVLALLYLLLAVGLTATMGDWWPLLAFALLLGGRVTIAWQQRTGAPEQVALAGRELMSDWVNSQALYIPWVFAGLMLPWPSLGLTPEVIAAAGVPGTGEWVERPQTLLVAGAGYFLCRAWLQWRGRPLIDVGRMRA